MCCSTRSSPNNSASSWRHFFLVREASLSRTAIVTIRSNCCTINLRVCTLESTADARATKAPFFLLAASFLLTRAFLTAVGGTGVSSSELCDSGSGASIAWISSSVIARQPSTNSSSASVDMFEHSATSRPTSSWRCFLNSSTRVSPMRPARISRHLRFVRVLSLSLTAVDTIFSSCIT